MIGRGMSELSSAFRSADASVVMNIPGRFQEAVARLKADPDFEDTAPDGEVGINEFFRLLSWLVNDAEPSIFGDLQGPAAMVLAGTGRRKAWVRRFLEDAYIEPLDSDALLRRYGDREEQALWQADSFDGRTTSLSMYFAESAPERAYKALQDRVSEIAGSSSDAKIAVEDVVDFLTRMDKVMVVGRPKEQMILGQDIVGALNQIKDPEADARFLAMTQWVTQRWKVWTLFNAVRFARYVANNLAGDVDAIGGSGYGKAIFSKIPRAARHIREFQKTGKAPDLMKIAAERGVMWSAQTVAEYDDIRMNEFSVNEKLRSMPVRAAKTYLNSVRGLALWRENVFRYAAFLGMYDEIITKKKHPLVEGYGSTPPDVIRGLNGMDLVTRMAIDIMGDYWLPQSGRWLRKYLVPFWSWQHSNAIRYIRRLKNLGCSRTTSR